MMIGTTKLTVLYLPCLQPSHSQMMQATIVLRCFFSLLFSLYEIRDACAFIHIDVCAFNCVYVCLVNATHVRDPVAHMDTSYP